MTISADLASAVGGYEAVPPGHLAASREVAIYRRRSAQPTRRAVLHVQPAGHPGVSSELVSWFNERAFHFYLADVPLPSQAARCGERHLASAVVPAGLPGQAALTGLRAARRLQPAFAGLDAARAYLRESDGIHNLIVTAAGATAPVVTLWSDARQSAADALILYEPSLKARQPLRLSIGCPVLVLGSPDGVAVSRRLRRTRPVPVHLGSHVTTLQLRCSGGGPLLSEGSDLQEVFGELGRWLGAYMYWQVRDRLL
jgi:hypothetical protein